ncbi:MAG: metallophosphoesterase family protein [Candidatus Latescibacterota bacterium]
MRLAIVADIHGNAPALEAVLADARSQGCEGLLVAGDMVGGVANDEVVSLLREAQAVAVRGNNEDYVIALATDSAPDAWHTSLQWAALRWSQRHTSRPALDFITALPAQRTVCLPGAPPILLVHGSPLDAGDAIYPDQEPGKVDQALAGIEETVLVCGHTHRPWCERRGARLALNPGSAGFSCNGDPRAWYGLLAWDGQGWQAELRAVDYDRAQTCRLFAERGLLAAGGGFARALLLGVRTGQPVAMHLVRHARQVAGALGLGSEPVLPDEVWRQAAETFAWERWERPDGTGG